MTTAKESLLRCGIWTARKQPSFAKAVLRCWAAVERWMPFHITWSAYEVANAIQYRIPATARLLNGMPMTVVWNDFIGSEIYHFGCYERSTVDVLRSILKPGMVVFDVGAHVGQYTLLASQAVGPSGAVHSFEPDPGTFALLERNVRRNRLSNVFLNRLALAERTEQRELYFGDPMHIGFNSLRPLQHCGTGDTCKVQCSTLVEYCSAATVHHIDLMKIDVEGAECEILRGSFETLRNMGSPAVLLEYNPHALLNFGSSCAELSAFFVALGYELFEVGEDSLVPYKPGVQKHSVFNVLAVSRSRLGVVEPLLGNASVM